MGRREDNKRQKRERLEQAGLELFLTKGFDRTSIEQIVSAAGVARGTYYLYFEDKLALFKVIADRFFTALDDQFEAVGAALDEATDRAEVLDIYRRMSLGIAMIGLAHRDELLLAFQENRRTGEAGLWLREREKSLHDATTAFTQSVTERGMIDVANPRLTTLIIFGAVERITYEVLVGSELGDPTQIADAVLEVFAASMGLPVDLLRQPLN